MLAALTLCLGLQSGVASAVPDTGARALHVFIEDEAGTLLVAGWSVQLGRLTGNTVRWLETASIDATSGVATFTALDEPTNFVQAKHDTGEVTRRELVALGPATEGALPTAHRIVFVGQRPERSLYVQVSDPLGLVRINVGTLVAVDRAGREITLVADPAIPGRHVARDVEPGGYRIELRDPRYLPVLLERHTPGHVATVHPVGSAALVVTFVDAVDGRTLTPEDLTTMTGVESETMLQGSVKRIYSLSTSAVGAGLSGEVSIDGLVPGTSTQLHATFPKHFAASVDVADIGAGEARRVTQRVERARSVLGTIVDPAGAPVQGVSVATVGGQSDGARVLAPRNVIIVSGPISVGQSSGGQGVTTTFRGRTSLSGLMGPSRSTQALATSDDAGRFELHGLGSGSTQLEARFTPWHHEALTLPALTTSTPPREGAPPLVVRAPGPCGADVQFVVPRGTTLAHYEVSLQLGDAPWLLPKDRVAPLVDEHEIMKLRGLTGAPCRLDVRLRDGSVWPPVPDTAPSSLTVEFVPDAGAPTRVRVDLGPLAGDQ